MNEVICPYCHKPASLLPSSAALNHGRELGPVWACLPCDAWVDVHKDSKHYAPLGRLANAELRQARQEAHTAFDPLWKAKIRWRGSAKHLARNAAYQWLAERMGVKQRDCHMGWFDLEQCRRVVAICRPAAVHT